MTAFHEIYEAACARMGGEAAVKRRLPKPKSAKSLKALGDDRYLSMMSLRIFRAGLKHSVVDAKWPAFEAAFDGFDPRRCAHMSDEDIDRLLGDTRLIRHGGKIQAVRKNAAAMIEIAKEHGSFGAWLADWPGERIVDLWDELRKRFSQLGGNSGPMFLRMAGKDSFVLSEDVRRGLMHWAGVASPVKGKAGERQAQEAFNAWHKETGRPLSELSMILALSTD